MRKNRGITLETINDEADTTQEEAMKKRKLRLTIERFVMLVMMMLMMTTMMMAMMMSVQLSFLLRVFRYSCRFGRFLLNGAHLKLASVVHIDFLSLIFIIHFSAFVEKYSFSSTTVDFIFCSIYSVYYLRGIF